MKICRSCSLFLLFLLLVTIFSFRSFPEDSVRITRLKVENKTLPWGVDLLRPRFSWNMESEIRGIRQTAWQIGVASSPEKLQRGDYDLWNSGQVVSDNSTEIRYNGQPLQSNRTCYWQVTVWDNNGRKHTSEPAFWHTGLFQPKDWKAEWIGLDRAVGEDAPGTPGRRLSARYLRHEFSLKKEIRNATAFICGLGLFELYLNGKKVGDQVLAPALSEYDKRCYYMTFDVTGMLRNGENAAGIILGNGRFFAPRSNIPTPTRSYGFPRAIFQIIVRYEDNTCDTVFTDTSWKVSAGGPIRANNEYDGEYYDARKEMPGWSRPGFNDSKWRQADRMQQPCRQLQAQPNEPIRVMDTLRPVSVREIHPGTFIYDMGQNMVGWVQLHATGRRGKKITLRFAERLTPSGDLFLDNIRTAKVTDTYILKGGGEEVWQPRFTYHGFRYVEVKGYPGRPALTALRGMVVHDALETTGTFSCSDTLVNSIYRNAFWGIRGNYRSIPTDCPQRDERQGWLGDRSAECTGESYLFNIVNLYEKWLRDIEDAQRVDGSIPDVAPSYWPLYNDNTTWPGTFLFAAEMLYRQYGDLSAIREHYPAMQKWIRHMRQYVKEGIMTRDTYGDWCVPPEDLKLIHSNDARRITPADYIGTAYFYKELSMMARFAHLLGKEEDARSYRQQARLMKNAFNRHFLDKNTLRYSNNSVTVNILALAFGLVPDNYRQQITDNLLQKILGEFDGHVGNGIIGGQWLMRTLTETGHTDVAWLLATRDTYPGWGYMVRQGATTIWELWNGDHGDPGMNSGNHVMLLGDLIIWFYEDLAGIRPDPDKPGFKHILMKPVIPGGLSHVEASFRSPYGLIESQWTTDANGFHWKVSLPANTSATLYIPVRQGEAVREGKSLAKDSRFLRFRKWEKNYAVFEAGAGTYYFHTPGVEPVRTKSYLPTPVITPSDTTVVKGNVIRTTITCRDEKATIRYTWDGQDPDSLFNAYLYKHPLEISRSMILKARAFRQGYHPSVTATVHYDFVDPAVNGIHWYLYRGLYRKLPDLSGKKPVAEGRSYHISLEGLPVPHEKFVLRFEGYIAIPQAGEYTFSTSSNDGSKLFIDDKLVVNNDGEHGNRVMSGTIQLTPGLHRIRVEYFQSGGTQNLQVCYRSSRIPYQPVPGSVLFLTDPQRRQK
jgi:alpha-L-rhamnosidase